MKTTTKRRPYAMRSRAEAAERLSERIIDAAYELWLQRSYDEFTLQDVADRAGASLSSVMRRFGSKEGIVEAIISTDRLGEATLREGVEAGDVDHALAVLVDGYERVGDAVLRNIALEDRLPVVGKWVEFGRRYHREWVARVFGEWLPSPRAADYRRRRAQFIVATDLYTWKILRRDQGLSRSETLRAMRDLVDRLIEED